MNFKIALLLIVSGVVAISAHNSDGQLNEIIDKIDNEKSLYLFGGLSVERANAGGRSFGLTEQSEDFVERASRYLETHELKFTIDDEEDTIGEARTGKLKKLALPLLLALKLKMSLILPIVLKALALISLKGLMAGSLALLFSAATLVRDLFNKKREQVTTAYITGPNPMAAEIIQQENWNRNGQVAAQDLAYNYHTLPHRF